ncbi:hypothetical protein V6N13_011485 [Hibiscus sabdariffa]
MYGGCQYSVQIWLKWFVALVVNCFHIHKEPSKLNIDVNFVLEAHQVGLVECGSCAVLLMYPYPYGAPSVKCSSCLCVTGTGVM